MSECIYVCTCVCMSARTFQAAPRCVFLCATNKRNDTILQVLFVDREEARSRSAYLHPEFCGQRSGRLSRSQSLSQ